MGWFKADSSFASGSSARVTARLKDQQRQADREKAEQAERERRANPKSKADKSARRR